MVTYQEARQRALAYGTNPPDIPAAFARRQPPLKVLDEVTEERVWGWIITLGFCWPEDHTPQLDDDAAAYVLLVERNGNVHCTGSARQTAYYVDNFEATGDPHLEGGRELQLIGASHDVDCTAAARLLHQQFALSIVKSKQALEAACNGHPSPLTTPSAEVATGCRQLLGSCGFVVRQPPDPS